MATSLQRRAATAAAGFTLVELMVTITIVSILMAVAVSSYGYAMRKSRRTEAKTALLSLAAREERYFSTNATYTNDAGNLGFSASSQTLFQMPVGGNYYQVSVCVASTTPPTIPTGCGTSQTAGPGSTFLLVATTIATSPQAKDTTCKTFMVDNTGVQSSQDNTGAASTGCW